jgi:hypothetical protein
MFIVTVFTVAKIGNQPACPTTNDWVKKMWYIYTMEYSTTKKNEIVSFTGKCMKLELIMLSKIS